MNVDEMREILAERTMESLDYHTTYCILMEGCQGYDNMSDEEIENQYLEHSSEPPKAILGF